MPVFEPVNLDDNVPDEPYVPKIYAERTVSTAMGDKMLRMVPPYQREDSNIVGIIAAQGAEYENIENAAWQTALLFFPTRITDSAHMTLWEVTLQLPIRPPITLEQRRDAVLNRLRSFASAGAGSNWSNAIDAIADVSWSYEEHEPDDYTIRIHIDWPSTSVQAQQLTRLVRDITPAHLAIVYDYGDGFIIGASEIGIDTL